MSLLTQIATQIDKSKKASENIASGKFTTDLVNAYPPEEIHLEEKNGEVSILENGKIVHFVSDNRQSRRK
ncbi:MAG: hypothetical protein AAB550_02535 [Patescibacteria group bacterium]